MSRATTPTLLSLDRYAQIMSLNPAHFSGAAGATFWPEITSCDDVWPQYSWQHQYEFVSREELAIAISEAEGDIKEELGFSPAPAWETEEVHWFDAPEHHGVRYMPWVDLHGGTSVKADWGYIISAGERLVTVIDAGAAISLSDPDGDTWNELATVTAVTSVTDETQIKLYFAGHSGEIEWEIRPLKTVVIAGGTATITLDSWLLLDPDLWSAVPTATSYPAEEAIDIEAAGSYVSTVDVYQETTTVVPASAEFLWEKHGYRNAFVCPACSGTGCQVCALTSVDGCLSVRDARAGIVTPFPATYDSVNDVWIKAWPTECRQPDMVKVNYHAGHIDQRYLRGETFDPLSETFAQAIAWLATARLDRDVCACDGIKKQFNELQRDLTLSTREAFSIRFESQEMFHCPWGTRVGEVKAWMKISKGTSKIEWDGGGF